LPVVEDVRRRPTGEAGTDATIIHNSCEVLNFECTFLRNQQAIRVGCQRIGTPEIMDVGESDWVEPEKGDNAVITDQACDCANGSVTAIHIWLGKKRICQIHLKDNPHYLGEGKIQFEPILQAILDIGFSGYANLETDTRPGMLEADMRRNLLYVRKLLA